MSEADKGEENGIMFFGPEFHGDEGFEQSRGYELEISRVRARWEACEGVYKLLLLVTASIGIAIIYWHSLQHLP